MMRPPGGAPGVSGINVCYSGPASGASKALEPIRGLGTPLNDGIKAIDYVDLQKSGDVTDPRAMGTYLKGGFSSELSPDMMAAIVQGHEGHPGRLTMFFTQHCGGAIGRVPTEAAAFAHRYALVNAMAVAAWPATQDGAPHMAWARKYWAGIEGFTRGWYTNEVASESAAEIDANYGPNYSRLVQLKNKYDPTNLFRLNANIRPA
jgi:FAD/FMN-containing dehydrogenase